MRDLERLVGMFLMRVPSSDTVRDFIDAEKDLPFSYDAVGATQGEIPLGFVVDQYRAYLGEGEAAFELAKDALRSWRQFDLEWIEVLPRNAPIEPGVAVAILARHYGFWSINSARIIHAIEDHGATERFGFAYGTLPGHAESGEERFTIEWDRESDTVSYAVLAFSRPNHRLARLGQPVARRLQARFARDSQWAIQAAVREGA